MGSRVLLLALAAAAATAAGCFTGGVDTDSDGFADTEDCGPGDGDVNPGAADPYGDELDSDCDGADGIDRDGDGYPANQELVDEPFYDCNDANEFVNPAADEIVGDGIDNDCDGAEAADADGDGFAAGIQDCDDEDPAVFQGAPELPNGTDDDCDTLVDEGTTAADDDGDGYCEGASIDGEPEGCTDGSQPGDCDDDAIERSPADDDGDGWSSCAGDCDDTRDARNLASAEVCDGLDNDCDLVVPTDEQDVDGDGESPCAGDCDDLDPTRSSSDGDLDGFSSCAGDCDDSNASLDPADADGDGQSSCDGDCDDDQPAVRTGLPELCDLLDNDCDGSPLPGEVDADGDSQPACLDCDDADPAVHSLDLDGDGISLCAVVPDCDDNDPLRYPGNTDGFGDGLDNNCDGLDGEDFDGDGSVSVFDCDDSDPAVEALDVDGDGFSTCEGDCDDADSAVTPVDSDGDGITACAGDCDDANPSVHPGAVELCDLLDNDCDGVTLPGEVDDDGDTQPACLDCDDADPAVHALDLDGDGISLCAVVSDCDDNDALRYPGNADGFGDGVDNNCDGLDGEDFDADGSPSVFDCDDNDPALDALDVDGDGFSTCEGDCDDADPGVTPLDSDGDGITACAGDCDDADPTVHPGAPELCDLLDNNCDGSTLPGEVDGDGDSQPACLDCDDADPAVHSLDVDGDGISLCSVVPDCDDEDALRFPGNSDGFGDGVDTNCDGLDGQDFDGDGSPSVFDCDDNDASANALDLDSDGFSTCDSDCDDSDAGLTPADSDGDGFSSCTGDCNDSVATVLPTAVFELCDGFDTNCDGVLPAAEADGDADGSPACLDCDDTDPAVRPGRADPSGDGVDSNCDGHDDAVLEEGLSSGVASIVWSACAEAFEPGLHDWSSATDLTGDGVRDIVIGSGASAFLYWDGSPFCPGSVGGAVVVHSGAAIAPGYEFDYTQGTIYLAGLSEVESLSPDGFGSSVIPADLDSDGASELVVGATNHVSADGYSGAVYVFAGLVPGGSYSPADAVSSILGDANNDALQANGACDIDADGFQDLLVSATGRLCVVPTENLAPGPQTLAAAALTCIEVEPNERDWPTPRNSVACGDVDGDGLAELLITPLGGGTTHAFAGSAIAAGGSIDATTSFFVVQDVGPVGTVLAMPGLDIDNDGEMDFLLPGVWSWPPEPVAFLPSSVVAAGGTVAVASLAGFSNGDIASGAAVGDWNDDGVSDVHLGYVSGVTGDTTHTLVLDGAALPSQYVGLASMGLLNAGSSEDYYLSTVLGTGYFAGAYDIGTPLAPIPSLGPAGRPAVPAAVMFYPQFGAPIRSAVALHFGN